MSPPHSLPPHQDIPSAWLGSEMSMDPAKWTLKLQPQDIMELEKATSATKALPLADLSAATFPLPGLAARLAQLRRELTSGRGFALITGLDPSRYTEAENSRMFYGFGAHLGHARSQNAAGDLLGHVRDVGADAKDTSVRIYQTAVRQSFHTDSCDVVGLICLKQAKYGGDSLLVSAMSIYNAMLESDPALLGLLFDPIATDRRGEVAAGQKPFFEIPVFTWHKGFLNIMYQRQYIDSAQRFAEALRLTPAHITALDRFDQLANDPKLNFKMRLKPGDMQFVHNHALLHDRTGFEDYPEPENRRHLLRLWLSIPGDRPLPDIYAQRFGTTTIGDRGGIKTTPKT